MERVSLIISGRLGLREEMTGPGYEELLKSMGVHFIECASIKEWFNSLDAVTARALSDKYSIGVLNCCNHCHTAQFHKIYVRPINPSNQLIDWFLGLEALVCCHLLDIAREIPYEWWRDKSKALGVDRQDDRGYVYPDRKTGSPSTTTQRSTKSSRVQSQRTKGPTRCSTCGDKVTGVICDNCGTPL